MEQLTDAIEQFIHGDNSYDDSERYKARAQLANLLSALKEAQDEIERLKDNSLKHIYGLKDVIVAKDAEIEREKQHCNDIVKSYESGILKLKAELAAAKEQEKAGG